MKLDTSSYYPEGPSSEPEELRGDIVGEVADETVSAPKPEETSGPRAIRKTDKDNAPRQGESFIDSLASVLSWVLVPLMMPVYGIMLVFSESVMCFTPLSTRIVFTLIVAGINVLLPMLLVLLLKKMGLVRDIGLNSRRERMIPYVITIVCLGATAAYMNLKGAPGWLSMFFVGGAVGGAVNFIVNFRWKISAHAAGISGVSAMLLRILKDGIPQSGCFEWLIVSVVLAGLLGSARVWLGRHTPAQVLAGYVVGFLSVFLLT